MLKNSTGGSSIGCLVTIAVVACCFYAGYKFAVVQWNIESFKEEMTELTRAWALDHKPENMAAIKADVIRRADRCGIELSPEDITVNMEGTYVSIKASWVEPIEFPGGYTYEREVDITRSIRKRGY